ncbi:MAG TPA: TylF/MycF/NovP-related O-methyltransferase [Chloroflexia bacterium]|jgi:hypothetical protein
MPNIAGKVIRRLGKRLGYDIVSTRSDVQPVGDYPPDFDAADIAMWQYVQPFTMTSKERIFALCRSVEYIIKHQIPGDIVECGVYKGGSMMAVAKSLVAQGAERKLYLFDTYEGMPDPADADVTVYGKAAADIMRKEDKATSDIWAYSPLEEVQRNLRDTGYDARLLVFVKGRVEETIPEQAPEQISLLRLDTDWYESTYHELVHLYPRLSVGGVLIIDDYGHWQGARKAVDQYIEENHVKVLLNRIDYTGRVCVKLEA